MSTLFYRNRRLLILAVLLIVVAGLAGYQSMPRLEDPELTQRFARIVTQFPGAKAERVEALMTEKLEEELFEIEELKVLESESTAGVSTLVVELNDHVTEVDEVWSRVRDKLDDAHALLPSGALEPEFEKQEVRAYALIAALTWRYDGPPNYAVLRRLAEQLEDRLRALPGTEQVDLAGDPNEEITVEVQPAELAARGLAVADISGQLEQSDARVSAGQLRSARGDLLIEIENQYDSVQRVRQTPIRFGAESQTVQLADIAQVSKGIAQPQADLAIVDGRPAVALGTLIESNRRIDHWATDAHDVLNEFKAELPDGVELVVVFDQSVYTIERLTSLMSNLILGAVAVVVVIWLLMGWRSAIVVGAALPLSALMVFAGMHLLGVPIHQMSVSGLIIALGLLIDNAIVMVDEVRSRLSVGRKPVEAISQSVGHLAIPLAGSTVTTALAFMPIALMPGGAGEFVGSIAVSVVLAIFSSLLLAMTVIPTLAGLLDSFGSDSRQASWWNAGLHSQRLLDFYRRSLRFLFARPALGLTLGVILPVIGFVQARNLPEQFFPPADRDMFQVEMELPSHTSLEETRRTAMAVRQQMMAHPQVENVHWFIGESAPSFYYNLVKQREHASQYAQAIVQLNSADGWQQNIRALQIELDKSFPEARLLVRQLEQGPPFKAPIEVRLFGPDLARLRQLGDEVRVILAALPDTLHTASSLADAQPKFGIQLDEEKARMAGLNNQLVARRLDEILEGTVGGSVLEATEELPVRVRLASKGRAALDEIASLEFVSQTADGRNPTKYVPLQAIGDVQLVPERANIPRRNGQRLNTVQAYITAGVLPGEVQAQFEQRLARSGFELPAGYRLEFGGESAERDTAIGNLLSSVSVLIVLMAATLVLAFGSFRKAAIIASVGALSVGLGLNSLWLFGFPFGFMAIIGTMGLVGVAINDSIVVLAALGDNRRASEGDPEATGEVVIGATRHVLSTTLTTIAGFTPLLIAGGGFWPPMAIAIAGGVTGSTILALYYVPSAYLIVRRFSLPVVTFADRQRGSESADVAYESSAFGTPAPALQPYTNISPPISEAAPV